MSLIDTHAHIFASEFEEDSTLMLARAQEAGITQVFMPNIDQHSIAPMLALEKQNPWCHALMGLHPSYVKEDYRQVLDEMEAWLEKRPFKGIGEAGLDLYWDKTFFKQQQDALHTQCQWAKKYRLPIVLHTREAFPETLDIIQDEQDGTLRGIFHCFSGTVAEAREAVEVGFLLGIGGVSTFKNGGLRPVLEQIDLDHLVLETDSPYLAPVPRRGKRNEPAYLPYIAQQVAEIKSSTLNEVSARTSANALRLFS